VTQTEKTSKHPASSRLAAIFGGSSALLLILLIFVSRSDATVSFFVGYTAMFAGTLTYFMLRSARVGILSRVLLALIALAVAAVLLSTFVPRLL
jgi:hypothetical protein